MSDGIQVRGRKVFDRTKGERVFINHFEIMHSGTDVYIDAGVVSPDQMIEAVRSREDSRSETDEGRGAGVPEVDFVVIERLAMSVNTFDLLREKVEEIFRRMKGRQLLSDSFETKTDEGVTPK